MLRIMPILMLLLLIGAGCVRVKVEPLEVKPITLNINLKIDRQLDDFFAFEREMAPMPQSAEETAK